MHWRAAASASTSCWAPPAIAAVDEDDEPRPSCNCKTSQCIQQYCQCFGNQWFCSDACRCASCYNVEAKAAFVEERSELILKSKPKAPRGCTCRKSKCKKNYCDCFKNRMACTERCKCNGCANTHGAKGGATLLHNNGNSGETSGGSRGAPDGPNGTSNETAEITNEASISPPGTPGNCEVDAYLKRLSDQELFFRNLRSLMRQGSVQAALHGSADSTPQGLLNPNINSGSQDCPSGN